MAQILEFVLKGHTFGPEEIGLMQQAYGAALDALSLRSAPDPERLRMAELVVQIVMSRRVSDPEQLSALAIEIHRTGGGVLDRPTKN